MNLIIDQGNTRVKLALFKEGRLLRKTGLQKLEAGQLREFLAGDIPQKAIVSSVGQGGLVSELKPQFSFPVYELSTQKSLPFGLNYNTPETLGLDRVALAAAAVSMYPGQDCLVMDAGTCLTYDFVDRGGVYQGGGIAPGLQMRYRALHEFTARLPLVEHQMPGDFIGNSTENSIRSGVAHGMFQEVRGTIQAYEARFPAMISVLTGGDAFLFEGLLKNSIFAAPEFLLHGLNHILEYYAEAL